MQEELDRPTDLRFSPETEPSSEVHLESIIGGKDDRKPVEETKKFPWRCHCSLTIRHADGEPDTGTGFLIGRRTVLTAGHCVFSHRHGGGVAAVRVTPGRNGTAEPEPFASVGAVGYDAVDGWTKHMSPAFDYGVLFLPSGFIPPSFGHFSCAALSDQQLMGLAANVAGYPVEKNGTLWWHGGRIGQVAPRFLGYPIDTTPGQSGAPIWTVNDEKIWAVGIHINGPEGGNVGVRITESVLATIQTWLQRGES